MTSLWIALCRAAGIKARYKILKTISDDVTVNLDTAEIPGLEEAGQAMLPDTLIVAIGHVLADLLNTGVPHPEGEACIDGKWVVADVGMRPEIEAHAGTRPSCAISPNRAFHAVSYSRSTRADTSSRRLQHFVHAGDRVLVKLNLSMSKPPDRVITTHPAMVQAIVELINVFPCAISPDPESCAKRFFYYAVNDSSGRAGSQLR